MPAPSEEQRVVRLDLEPSRERRDGFAKLPRTGLGDAEVDDARNVLRVGLESGSRALDGVRYREASDTPRPRVSRYCTDGTPVWPASSAGPRVIAAATMDVNPAR
jgi:hypothetical protein